MRGCATCHRDESATPRHRVADPRRRRAAGPEPRVQRLQLRRRRRRAEDHQGQPPLPLPRQGRARGGADRPLRRPLCGARSRRSTAGAATPPHKLDGLRRHLRRGPARAAHVPLRHARGRLRDASQPMREAVDPASSTTTRPGSPACSNRATGRTRLHVNGPRPRSAQTIISGLEGRASSSPGPTATWRDSRQRPGACWQASPASSHAPGPSPLSGQTAGAFWRSQRSIVLLKLALQPGRQPRSDGRRKRLRRGRGEEPRRKAFAAGPATPSRFVGVGSCDHAGMASLGAKERAQLPDSAFAYIDSRGQRRLPIHDASHVRNALARFSQVAFEDEAARDRARSRLLRAAQKHGIMPIGFISAQLQPQLKLPKGLVTFLLTDIEGSTELLGRLNDQYALLLGDVRRRVRAAVRQAAGRGVRPRRRCLRGVRTQPGGTSGRVGDPAGDALRRLARGRRRTAANRPASRPSRAHRYRLRRPLSPRRRAHLLRSARRPDRDVLCRSRGGPRVAPGGGQPAEPWRVAIPRPARAGGSLPSGRG